MKSMPACVLIFLSAVATSGGALASNGCGMNSNKPCPEKSIAKEPAYGTNNNRPRPQQLEETPARAEVKAADDAGATAAKATLSGVSPSDLKLKPKPPKVSEKEKPA